MSDHITRAELGKVNRALKKIGIDKPSLNERQQAVIYLREKLISIIDRSSTFLSKVLRARIRVSSSPIIILQHSAKEDAKIHSKMTLSLRKAGYDEPSEQLIEKACHYLNGLEIDPLIHQCRTLGQWLRDFEPTIIVQPTANKKFAELSILATALSLAVPVSPGSYNDTAVLEATIRQAAKSLTEPLGLYPREIALRYGITFEGTLLDCFGFWERGNAYCERCLDREACSNVVKEASLGALANPAMKEFQMSPDFDRISQPLKVLSPERTSEGTLAAVTERKALLSWLDSEFPELTRVDYTESTNYQISNPYNRRRMVLLKVEKFSPRAYSVIFSAASLEQADRFSLSKIRHGWTHTTPDLPVLQTAVRGYLKIALDIPAVSVALSREEEIKQEIQKSLVDHWTGRIEHRSGYDIFVDTRGQKILRFNRFDSRGFQLDFSRWNLEKATEHGLKYTSSGARYEGASKEELEKLLQVYLHSLKSKHFKVRSSIA